MRVCPACVRHLRSRYPRRLSSAFPQKQGPLARGWFRRSSPLGARPNSVCADGARPRAEIRLNAPLQRGQPERLDKICARRGDVNLFCDSRCASFGSPETHGVFPLPSHSVRLGTPRKRERIVPTRTLPAFSSLLGSSRSPDDLNRFDTDPTLAFSPESLTSPLGVLCLMRGEAGLS